jgi:hypothetical protein
MTRSLTIGNDPAAVRPSVALAAAARAAPLLVVTHRAFADLVAELGSFEATARHLARVATNTGRPIGINAPTPDGSRTMFIPPKGWTRERLAGWIGGHHELLEREFGASTLIAGDVLQSYQGGCER